MHKPNFFRGQLVGVIRESDGASIPLDPSNPDYAAFLSEQESLPEEQRLDLTGAAPDQNVLSESVEPLTAAEIVALRAMLAEGAGEPSSGATLPGAVAGEAK